MTNIDLELSLKGYIPLCFIDDNVMIISKRNKVFIYNLENKSIIFLIQFPTSFYKNLFSRFNILNRLLRLGVRKAIKISNDVVLIVFDSSFFEIKISDKSLKKVFTLIRGNRPLNITEVISVSSFDKGFYFGEYFENFEKNPVHIYKRLHDSSWEVVFTFAENTIEHIHNIVADPLNDCLWILTGDFNNAAAIYMAKNNFKEVIPILKGKQKFRACVAFPTENGLLYATDSQFEQNSIRILKNRDGIWISEFMFQVNGPVIYGCKVNENYFFSTSVEGDSISKGRFLRYFDRKRGLGILEDFSHIVGGNLKDGFSVLYKCKKDRYPFILFQFGAILFPEGINNSNKLVAFCIGLVRNDLVTNIYKLK